MSFIAEYTHDLHVLQATFETIPDLRMTLETVHPGRDDADQPIVFYHWLTTDEFDALEAAMAADPDCDTNEHLTSVGGRRLYRTTLTEGALDVAIYPLVTEYDIGILDVTMARDGVEARIRVPSHETVATFREDCQERGVSFHLRRLYREQGDSGSTFGLTEPQREALVAALDAGYFSVPRETTLSAVAETLDISSQALSARLRRGHATLLRNTLATAGI